MSCKFKDLHAGCIRPYCRVTNGECQFIISPWDDKCPILHNYKDWKGGIDVYDNVYIVKDPTTGQGGTAYCTILNIIYKDDTKDE